MEGIAGELYRCLEARGYRARIVDVAHVADLQTELESRHSQGLLDEEFYREELSGFSFDPAAHLPGARSIVVVAVPDAETRIVFHWPGGDLSTVVPPTYAFGRVEADVAGLLTQCLKPHGLQVARVVLPKKPLAVHSGLARYGRNNVTYVPGMGTYFGLVVFLSDLPCPEDSWQPLQMLERCERCTACLKACPTGAITAERFLLHAERCLTFHNERDAAHAFPGWVDPAWHAGVLGCMRCQRVCPENRGHELSRLGPEFSREETALLLRGAARDALPHETVEKLEESGLMAALEALPRNLAVLLAPSGAGGAAA